MYNSDYFQKKKKKKKTESWPASQPSQGGITLRAGETFFALNPVIFKVGS